MGTVYKANDPALDRTVAVKVLPGHLAGDADFTSRFKREAMAAAKLNHPNVVQVHAAGEDAGTHYIVMEFVDGETLHKRLQRVQRLDIDEALAITLYVADALRYAWNKAQIIHRDIKPDNILLSTDGEVKLTDLGLAKSLREASVSVTSTGTIMGSAQYISPEQARGQKDVDFRTDIYSLGCTLFHMLAGRPPYEGDETMALLYKHVNEPPPDPRTLRPDCPPRVAAIVLKMMAKDRAQRPATYDELICELTALHAEATGIAAAPTLAPTVKPATAAVVPTVIDAPTMASAPAKKRKTMLVCAGVAAAVLLLIAGVTWWVVGRVPPRGAGTTPPPPAVGSGPTTTHLVADAFLKEVAALPAEEQVKRVVAELQRRNPGFDGKEEHKIVGGQVTELKFCTVGVSDIAPVCALSRLRILKCEGEQTSAGTEKQKGLLADLTPLAGLALDELLCGLNQITDLSPLKQLRMTGLMCGYNPISDLSPLAGMPLHKLGISAAKIADLSPLRGMPLKELDIRSTRVTDLSPLRRMPLTWFRCDFDPQRDTEVLRSIKTLEKINNQPAAEFWKQMDDGKMPAATSTADDVIWKNAIDLLPLIDPQKDAVTGTWTRVANGLISPTNLWGVMEIPYQPSEEYDFRVTFSRLSGDDAVVLILAKSGCSFAWGMGSEKNSICCFSMVAGKAAVSNNPTSVKRANWLVNNREHITVVSVRRDGLKAFLDGELITEWKTDYNDMRLSPSWKLRDQALLGLGNKSPVIFHRIEVREVTGKGTFTRTPPLTSHESRVTSTTGTGWTPLDIAAACNANVIRTEREKVTNAFGISGRTWATTEWLRTKGFDRTGLPDDGQIAIPNTTPDGFFQLHVADGKDSILVSIRGESTHAGRIPTNATLNIAANQQRKFSQLAFLHASAPCDAEVSVTIRYDTGPDGAGILHARSWSPELHRRREPVAANQTVAIRTTDGSAAADAVEMLAEVLPVDPQRAVKSLTFAFRRLSPNCEYPLAAEKGIAGIFAISALPGAPVTRHSSLVTSADDSFLTEVAALPAEEQVKRVVAELQRLNPGFDGKVTREIWGGWGGQLIVGRLAFNTQSVTNISPVGALRSLQFLGLDPAPNTTGVLTDLSPLKGLPLTELSCAGCPIRDISPLKGMPLKNLVLNNTPVEDLSPLSEMPLKVLRLSKTPVSDLSPLKGLKLTTLNISGTRVASLEPLRGMPLEELLVGGSTVSDLTPLKGMPLRLLDVSFTGVNDLSVLRDCPLKELNCNLDPTRDAATLRAIKTLEKINGLPAAEFWKTVK
jgi:Leucine-rich repeat (LRR) protein